MILEDAASKLGWDSAGSLANLKEVIKNNTEELEMLASGNIYHMFFVKLR